MIQSTDHIASYFFSHERNSKAYGRRPQTERTVEKQFIHGGWNTLSDDGGGGDGSLLIYGSMVMVLDETVRVIGCRSSRSWDVSDRLFDVACPLAGGQDAEKTEAVADASTDLSAGPQAAAHILLLAVAVMAAAVTIVLRALHQCCDERVPLRGALLPGWDPGRVATFPGSCSGRQGEEFDELERRGGVAPPAGRLPLRDPGKLLPRERDPGGGREPQLSRRGRAGTRSGRGVVGKEQGRRGWGVRRRGRGEGGALPVTEFEPLRGDSGFGSASWICRGIGVHCWAWFEAKRVQYWSLVLITMLSSSSSFFPFTFFFPNVDLQEFTYINKTTQNLNK